MSSVLEFKNLNKYCKCVFVYCHEHPKLLMQIKCKVATAIKHCSALSGLQMLQEAGSDMQSSVHIRKKMQITSH